MLVRLLRTGVVVMSLVALSGGRGAGAEPDLVCESTKVYVPDALRPAVTGMLSTSATFRRQWRTIARRERVHVAIFLSQAPLDPGCRAKTEFRRYSSGLLLAVIYIAPGDDPVELLAHELEHVIEQIEDVNLAALAHDGSARAKRRHDGAYETTRARDAGLAVAAEVRIARPE